ncbi:MAG: Jag N-terminal domain-containing protein [Elusimicrobia bacterium]|nr:Jag N-terminal domain-containing protein [Elusimicrobiota bacterium]
MNDWIGEGRTTEDAVARGLARLKLRLDQVEVQELGERQSGLLSMFGFRRVKVRLVEIPRKGARFDRRLDDERGDRRHEHRDERGGRASGRRDEPRTRRESPGPQKSERRDARRADGRGKNRPPREERRPDREPREARKPAPPPRPPERRDAPRRRGPRWRPRFCWDNGKTSLAGTISPGKPNPRRGGSRSCFRPPAPRASPAGAPGAWRPWNIFLTSSPPGATGKNPGSRSGWRAFPPPKRVA